MSKSDPNDSKWANIRLVVSYHNANKEETFELLSREIFRTGFKTTDSDMDMIDEMLDSECHDHFTEWLDDEFGMAEYHDCRGPMPNGTYEVVAVLWGHIFSDTSWEGEDLSEFVVNLRDLEIRKLSLEEEKRFNMRLNNSEDNYLLDEEGERDDGKVV